MIRELEFDRVPPKSGVVRKMVVFLHGYGADGADLLSLSEPLAPHLPDTVFIAPNAPEPCSGKPFGRQWFPIPRLDGASEVAAAASLMQSADDRDCLSGCAAEGRRPYRCRSRIVWVFTRNDDGAARCTAP